MAGFMAGGLVAIINLVAVIINLIDNKKTKKAKDIESLKADLELMKKGQMYLLYDRVNHFGNKAIEQGSISNEQLRAITEMHKAYHDLGGNGYLDTLMMHVKELDIN